MVKALRDKKKQEGLPALHCPALGDPRVESEGYLFLFMSLVR